MRLLIHDYSGHPFQVQLSRELADRGHSVLHLYNGSNPTTPKGPLGAQEGDTPNLLIDAIRLPRDIVKTAFFERWRLERLYGRHLAASIRQFEPELVMAANTPLDALMALDRACATLGIPWIYWLQDLIGVATQRILRHRLLGLGSLVGDYYRAVESRLLQHSAAVIGITEDFREPVQQAGVPTDNYRTIPNWAPLADIEPVAKRNPWSLQQGLHDRFVFLYTGTLGFKHNPQLLLELARHFRSDRHVSVVVNSQGPAAEWLRTQGQSEGLTHLQVNPYQPYEHLSAVLGSADVLVCLLEPDAGLYSVPSKVLAYHCAGRSMLLAVPEDNLAAQIVLKEGTGRVVPPDDAASFVAAAQALHADGPSRQAMGQRARAYAEQHFDAVRITDRFERVFERVREEIGRP